MDTTRQGRRFDRPAGLNCRQRVFTRLGDRSTVRYFFPLRDMHVGIRRLQLFTSRPNRVKTNPLTNLETHLTLLCIDKPLVLPA